MKYLILILVLIVGGCTSGEPTNVDHQICLACGCGPQEKPVKLKEVMIEVQNNARECAVRVWSRASTRPLFEVEGSQGLHNCRVYVIHNADIKPKSNELRGNE